ncbi:MAG: DegV family protein [Clostridia bacterium]|nr:DegV family protein [Clostridia bacterium]
MVKILVDSASDINVKEANELGINLIPMEIRFGTEEFLDGVNLYPDEFYDKLVESTELPKTSLINEFRWEETFQELTQDGSEVVAITISSKLSGTYEAAKKSAKKFEGKVFVVDSMNACAGERLLVDLALRLVKEGKTGSEIKQELDQKKEKIKIMAMVNTLEYLRKGGRISSVVAVAGTMLSIKPVVALVDGKVKMVGKAMGSKKANNLLNSLVEKCGGIDFTMPYCAIWSGKDNTVLQKYIKDSAHLWAHAVENVRTHMIGSTIGTHVGPGAVGVAFFEK